MPKKTARSGKSRKIRKERVTIDDIARLAGVSVSSVSRVINNVAGWKTREKVLKIIEKYDYYPNSFAQYLARKRGKKQT